MEHVVLVDELDQQIGTMEKMEAHRVGALHRAFSILLFNSKGEMLLQKRAESKYHSAGLWTNTCCSHPLPGETMKDATVRRLVQEMGISLETDFIFKFKYKTHLDHDFIEHEIDYVFTGTFNGEPIINTVEVEDWKFATLDEVRQDMKLNPNRYTYWFKVILGHPFLESAMA